MTRFEDLTAVPREFSEDELAGIEHEMKQEAEANPLFPIGISAAQFRLLVTLGRHVNAINQARAEQYPGLVRGFDDSRVQNPETYPLALRPAPAKKLLVWAAHLVDSPYKWPVAVEGEERVCAEIPPPKPPVDKWSLPLTVSIGAENPRVPGEYVALPDDNAPNGYAIPAGDKLLVKRIFQTPFGLVGVWQTQ